MKPSDLKEVLSKIQKKSKILESRILELIDYVKMETGEWRLSLEKGDLNPIFSDLYGVYHDEIEFSGRKFELIFNNG